MSFDLKDKGPQRPCLCLGLPLSATCSVGLMPPCCEWSWGKEWTLLSAGGEALPPARGDLQELGAQASSSQVMKWHQLTPQWPLLSRQPSAELLGTPAPQTPERQNVGHLNLLKFGIKCYASIGNRHHAKCTCASTKVTVAHLILGKTIADKAVDKLQTSYRENKQISGTNNLWVAITKIKVE